MQAEIERAFSKWMKAKWDYQNAQDEGRPESEIQAAYDAMKAARTKYRTLKNMKP